jgi:hypothetical protein
VPAQKLTILRVPPSKHRPRDVRSVAMAPCAALGEWTRDGLAGVSPFSPFGCPRHEPFRHGRDHIHRLALY